MYTRVAQADYTTVAVNIIVMSYTTPFLELDVHYTYGGVSPISGKLSWTRHGLMIGFIFELHDWS